MSARRKTAFDRWITKERRDPAFDRGYREARAEVDATDRIIRALDARACRQIAVYQ